MNDSDINDKLQEQVAKSLEGMSGDEVKDVFIESLIFEKTSDEDDLDDEVIAELKADLSERFDIGVNDKILESLPEEEVKKLDILVDEGAGPEEIRKFLERDGVKVDELVANVMQELRSEYIGEEE